MLDSLKTSLNIFDYATKELSQDAFLLWLLAHAARSNKDVAPDVTACAEEFLRLVYKEAKETGKDYFQDLNEDMEIIGVKKQYEHIDVLAETESNIVIIEDKTTSHLGKKQAEKYKEAIEELKTGKKVIVVYYKTYDEWQTPGKSQSIDCSINRKMMIEVLERAKQSVGCLKSEILADYYDRLKRLEDECNSWREIEAIPEHGSLAWTGFLLDFLNNSQLLEGFTAGKTKSGIRSNNIEFWGLWWDPIDSSIFADNLLGKVYLQLEHGRVSVRLSSSNKDGVSKDFYRALQGYISEQIASYPELRVECAGYRSSGTVAVLHVYYQTLEQCYKASRILNEIVKGSASSTELNRFLK